jgi:hypothetical protein
MSSDEPIDPAAAVSRAMSMRASDADREKVAATLRDAYADGRLSLDEHEERLSEVYRATTYAELVPVLRDLPVPPGTIAVPQDPDSTVAPSNPGVVVRGDSSSGSNSNMIAIFGGFERKGAWAVPAEMKATCVFGGGELDMTSAVFTSKSTTITAVCVFGGLEIKVPEGIEVQAEGLVAIFGGHSLPRTSAPPGSPVLIIKGAAVFGGIDVKRV